MFIARACWQWYTADQWGEKDKESDTKIILCKYFSFSGKELRVENTICRIFWSSLSFILLLPYFLLQYCFLQSDFSLSLLHGTLRMPDKSFGLCGVLFHQAASDHKTHRLNCSLSYRARGMWLEERKGVRKHSVYSWNVSITVLNGWSERGGHVNPGAAALLCWLPGECWGDSALVALGVPTEPVPEAGSLRTQAGKAVSWFKLCWSRRKNGSEYSRSSGFDFEREPLLCWKRYYCTGDWISFLSWQTLELFIVLCLLWEKKKPESFRQ